jgi:RNA-directed DNA polymerase
VQPPTHVFYWHEINWRTVNESVRRLQVRIVKAVEAGKWGTMKSLQRLLTSWRNDKLLAVRRMQVERPLTWTA